MRRVIIICLILQSFNLYSLDLNFKDFDIIDSELVLTVAISSSTTFLLPDTVMKDIIYKEETVFGNEVHTFFGYLKKSNTGNYTLFLSNENIGIIKFIYPRIMHTVPLRTSHIVYVPFSGKRDSKILLESVTIIKSNDLSDVDNFIVDRIYLEYCYSTNIHLENKRPYDLEPIGNSYISPIKIITSNFILEKPVVIPKKLIRFR